MSGGCTLANVLNQEKGYLSSDAVQISPAPQTPHYGPFERPPGQIHSTYQSNQMQKLYVGIGDKKLYLLKWTVKLQVMQWSTSDGFKAEMGQSLQKEMRFFSSKQIENQICLQVADLRRQSSFLAERQDAPLGLCLVCGKRRKAQLMLWIRLSESDSPRKSHVCYDSLLRGCTQIQRGIIHVIRTASAGSHIKYLFLISKHTHKLFFPASSGTKRSNFSRL